MFSARGKTSIVTSPNNSATSVGNIQSAAAASTAIATVVAAELKLTPPIQVNAKIADAKNDIDNSLLASLESTDGGSERVDRDDVAQFACLGNISHSPKLIMNADSKTQTIALAIYSDLMGSYRTLLESHPEKRFYCYPICVSLVTVQIRTNDEASYTRCYVSQSSSPDASEKSYYLPLRQNLKTAAYRYNSKNPESSLKILPSASHAYKKIYGHKLPSGAKKDSNGTMLRRTRLC